METDDLSADDNNFMHYVLCQHIFQQVHTLNTASYVCINKAMLSVDKVRQRIVYVYQMNSQANSDFSFRKFHQQLRKDYDMTR
jgi:hypothetical protein